MDLYKFSFMVLTLANGALGYLQYQSKGVVLRSRANSNTSITTRKRSFVHHGGGGGGDVEGQPAAPSPPRPFVDDHVEKEKEKEKHHLHHHPTTTTTTSTDQATVWDFQKTFFSVYLLVMAADWLQGPYLYTLYRDEKKLSERATAVLFATGFVSAAVSASFVGGLADLHGRKQACLAFCGLYSLSCLSMVSNSVFILFVGRVLGGISTTLMYSVFETWMVHEYHARQMASKGAVLGKIFGMMTTSSSVVAIVAGIVGEAVVGATGTKTSPFLVAFACLGGAGALISQTWNENHGSRISSKDSGIGIGVVGAGTDIRSIIKDKRIVALGVISCLFEGSMYLFVFFWSAALKSARAAGAPAPPTGVSSSTATTSSIPAIETNGPPFGLIFAIFMSAMMVGSQLFTIASTTLMSSQPPSPNLSLSSPQASHLLSTHIGTLGLVILLAAFSFLIVAMRSMSSALRKEEIILWGFCLFEACVGVYYPTMGFIRGQVVQDGIRGKVYGLLRLPLNVFVVSVLGVTVEGDRYREGVFVVCGGLLIAAYVVSVRVLN